MCLLHSEEEALFTLLDARVLSYVHILCFVCTPTCMHAHAYTFDSDIHQQVCKHQLKLILK